MNQSKSVGIIIPTYNVEPYIKDCLDSIINQTYPHWKAVIIDDCGTDNSINIVKHYAKKDNRFIILHNETNRGQSYSRNRGIAYFTETSLTDYIIFLDPDDYWQHNLLEQCVTNIGDADMLLFNCINVFENNRKTSGKNWNRNKDKRTVFNIGHKGLSEYIIDKPIWDVHFYPFCYLVLTGIVARHRIKFIHGIIYEDNIFTLCLIGHADNIRVLNKELYYYRRREGSSIRNNPDTHTFSGTDIYEHIGDNAAASHYYIAYCWANSIIHTQSLKKVRSELQKAINSLQTYWATYCLQSYYRFLDRGGNPENDPYGLKNIIMEHIHLVSNRVKGYREVARAVAVRHNQTKRLVLF